MVDRICQQEMQGRQCYDSPALAVRHTAQFGRMDPQARTEITGALERHGDDEQFVRDVWGLVTAPGAEGLSAAGWEAVLDALAEHRDRGAVTRLGELVGDGEFQWSPSAETAREAAEGSEPSARALASRAGVPMRSHDSFSALGAAEWAAHGAAEWVAVTAEHLSIDVTTAAAVATTGGVVGSAAIGVAEGAAGVLAVYAGLREIARAHEEAEELRDGVLYAQGVVDGLEHRMSDVAPGAQSPAGARGVDRGEQLWAQLTPAQRASLRAMPPADRQAFVESVRLALVERRAIAGQ